MINKEPGVHRRNNPTCICRIKEVAAELSIFDVADRRCFHDRFRNVANEACIDAAYPKYQYQSFNMAVQCAPYFSMLVQPLDRQQGENS